MAAPGRKPKSPELTRNKRPSTTVDWVEVVDTPYTGPVPSIPETRVILTREGQETVTLLSLTHDWWAVLTRMPHCVLWTESDWQFAISTAIVADIAFSGVTGAMTELRVREKDMATTVEYRRVNKIRYIDADSSPAPLVEVSSIDDYRDL